MHAHGIIVKYTTQVNSTFRACWLASSQVISQVLVTWAEKEKENGFCQYIVTNNIALWSTSYSACVVFTKTIVHLHFGE